MLYFRYVHLSTKACSKRNLNKCFSEQEKEITKNFDIKLFDAMGSTKDVRTLDKGSREIA